MPAPLELTAITVEEPEQQVVALGIEVSAGTVRDRVRSVFRQLSREANIPGFRKGHAPKELLRRYLGAEKIRREVTDELVPAAYDQALKDKGIDPLERASIEIVEFGEDQPLKIKARVTVKPEVTLGEYTGVAIDQEKSAVTEGEIDEQLEALREAHAVLQEVDRPLQKSDVVTGDLLVAVEDETKVRKRELGPLEIGTGNLVPPIDEQLLGASVGDERKFAVTYPDDYKDESLRGKNAEFTVTVTSVKEKLLPDLDDELAREVDAEFETLDALKTRIRERRQAAKDTEANIAARKKVVEAVVAGARLEFAPSWLDRRAEHRFQQLMQDLTQRSITLDEYLESQKKTTEEVKARLREEVERDSKRELVLAAIAKQEGVEIEAAEVDAELVALARSVGQDPRALADRMFRNGTLRALEVAVFERKVAEWLLSKANVTYVERTVSSEP